MIYSEEKNNLFDNDVLTREETLEKIDVRWLARFLSLTTVAVFLPFFIHLPWITGPIVNAVMILVLLLSGLRSALLVACLPSLMALSGGLLPFVLAPVVPFIIISNFIFIFTIDWFNKNIRSDFNGYWSGILAGAFVKFVFLFFSISFLAAFFIKSPVMNIVTQMLGWSQLLTALAGGVIAFGVLKFLKYFK